MSEFKSFSDLVIALYNYQVKGIVDSRFNKNENGISLKAVGNSELTQADGGFLVGGEIVAPLLHSISQKSTLFAKASKFYSSGNNVNKAFLPFVDETHRTTSDFQMKAYWVGEGSDKTKSKFSIGLAECKFNKVYCNVALSSELWSDNEMFRSSLEKFITSMQDGSLLWKIEAGILYGDGSPTNGMYGIMGPSSNGTISVAQADPLDEATLNAFNDALAPATHKTSEWYMSEENYIELQAINFTNENDKYYKDGDLYIYGKKVNVLEQMVTPYDLMLGDVNQYAVVMRSGQVESLSTVHVLFNTDERQIRFGLRINGKSFGSAYDLDDGTSVGTFVVSATTPAEESSSSSSVDSSSSSSSSNSSSSNSSTSSVDSHSSESSSSESSDSSSSLSSASSGSTSSSSSTDLSVSSSSSQSSALVGPCEEFYTASGFTGDTSLNGVYDVVGRHNSKAYYSNAAGTRFLFWSSTFSLWALAAAVGAAPANWLSNSATGTACPNGSYLDVSGTIA